jgi:hypothetical protein
MLLQGYMCGSGWEERSSHHWFSTKSTLIDQLPVRGEKLKVLPPLRLEYRVFK